MDDAVMTAGFSLERGMDEQTGTGRTRAVIRLIRFLSVVAGH